MKGHLQAKITQVSSQKTSWPPQISPVVPSPWLLCTQLYRRSRLASPQSDLEHMPMPMVLTTLKHCFDIQVATQEEVRLPFQSLQGTQTGSMNPELQRQPGSLQGTQCPRQPLPGHALTWAHPQQMADSHSTAGNHHFTPPQEYHSNSQAVCYAQDLQTPGPEDRCHSGVQTLGHRGLLSHQSRSGSSTTPRTRAAMQGSAETSHPCALLLS